jgi:TatD DNase family protein
MEFIDTHCHIYYDKYNHDINDVINRASNNNVNNIICVGVDLESSRKSLELAEQYQSVFATVGYHPHEAKLTSENYLDEIKKISQKSKVVAIGEIGLDYYYEHSDKKIQIKVFREQLELAKELNMPTIIHNRESDDDLYHNIKESNINKGVIHCYSSDIKYANKLFELGLIVSFTGIITFSKNLQEVVKEIPMDKIMIETDSPYLTPIPFRGKRNEPYMVNYVAEKIAEIKNISVEEVAEITTKTAKDFFSI